MGRLEAAIAHGLTQSGALRALTISPAEILGADAQLGTLEKGKIANLILFKGDIFAKDAKVRAVMSMVSSTFRQPGVRRERRQRSEVRELPAQMVLSEERRMIRLRLHPERRRHRIHLLLPCLRGVRRSRNRLRRIS